MIVEMLDSNLTEGVGEIGYLPVLENIKNRGFLKSGVSPSLRGRAAIGSSKALSKAEGRSGVQPPEQSYII